MNNTFEARLDSVPMNPGVYLMKDSEGSVIYVGKANHLRQRLSSYFGAAGPQGGLKVRAMVSHVASFDFVICENELEALVLESNLIKSYQPFYNILLRDDRDYPYLRITLNEQYPRILKAYRIGPDKAEGAKYYGPFLAGDLYYALRTIHELFPLKTCRRVFPRDIGKERPCLNYYIHRCIGPCLGDVSEADYREVMLQVCDYLEGRYSTIVAGIKEKMLLASEAMRFEEAAEWRDKLQRLEKLLNRQIAVTGYKQDTDALGLARSQGLCCVVRLALRGGKITETTTHFLNENGEEEAELLLAFIAQYYSAENAPRVLLLPIELNKEDKLAAQKFLSLEQGLAKDAQQPEKTVALAQIASPQRGAKTQIMDMACNTAREALQRKHIISGSSETVRTEGLRLLSSLTGQGNALARRIEAFDVANYGETDKASSMIVFTDGKADKSAYRLFKIKTVEGQDDYASMREALERRLDRLGEERFGNAPQLLLVDGGLQHVAMAKAALEERKLLIPVAGMVKDERHRTRGLALASGEIIELADIAYPRKSQEKRDLPRSTVAENAEAFALNKEEARLVLNLLTRIQDEAHRVAGTYTKKLSKKRQLRYKLEDIPGVGPQRRKALMDAFPSIKVISTSSAETLLEKVPGLDIKTAEAIAAHFAEQRKDT